MLIGNSFSLADYAWKNWQTESPMCHCGKSEETTEHFFLACRLYQDIRPEDIDSLNLLDPDDCNTGKWSLGLMPFGAKSFGLIQLVTWLNFFKLSVSGFGHLA